MADAPGNLPARTADRNLDGATRERLLTMLQDELARASGEALARGMSLEELTAQVEERISRLRAQMAGPLDGSEPETREKRADA